MDREFRCGPSHTVLLCLYRQYDRPTIVELTAKDWGYSSITGQLYLDHSEEAATIATLARDGECPPEILADWVEDHPECWRGGERARDDATVICDRLRRVTYSRLVN